VGPQKLRHWGPKDAVWDDDAEEFVFPGEQPDRRSVEATAARVCSESVNSEKFDRDERRRAVGVMRRIGERFTDKRDTYVFAQSLANSSGKDVQVFRWNESGEREEVGAFNSEEGMKRTRKRKEQAEEAASNMGDNKGQSMESSGVEESVEALRKRLREREEVELRERKAKADKKAAAAKREEIAVKQYALPMEMLEKVQKAKPDMDLREQILEARQLASVMGVPTGHCQAQAGISSPFPTKYQLHCTYNRTSRRVSL
jgi:hypothetical protein